MVFLFMPLLNEDIPSIFHHTDPTIWKFLFLCGAISFIYGVIFWPHKQSTDTKAPVNANATLRESIQQIYLISQMIASSSIAFLKVQYFYIAISMIFFEIFLSSTNGNYHIEPNLSRLILILSNIIG